MAVQGVFTEPAPGNKLKTATKYREYRQVLRPDQRRPVESEAKSRR